MCIASNRHNMDTAPIKHLPAELCNKIYEYALASNEPIAFQNALPAHALSNTCRQFRDETLFMYYSLNTFALKVESRSIDTAASLVRQFRERDCSRLNAMNKLQLVVDEQKTGVQCDQLRAAVEQRVMQKLEGTRLQGDNVEFQWRKKKINTRQQYLEGIDRFHSDFLHRLRSE